MSPRGSMVFCSFYESLVPQAAVSISPAMISSYEVPGALERDPHVCPLQGGFSNIHRPLVPSTGGDLA